MSSAIAVKNHDLEIERFIDAPRDLLFEVWSQPKHIVNWWGPSDFTLPFCKIDFRVGGKYRFCMRSPEGEEHWVTGVYREISEPDKIVFTWVREDTSGNPLCDTLVTVTFEESEDRTRFTLIHTGFDSRDYRDEHIGGWSQCIDRLEKYVTV